MNATTQTPTDRQQFLTDVLITAVEGGIGYWSRASHYYWNTPVEDRGVTLYIDDIDAQDVLTKVLDDSVDAVVTRVTLEDIEAGIHRIMFDDKCRVPGEILVTAVDTNATNDASDIDAEMADVIIQAAVFGEIVFG